MSAHVFMFVCWMFGCLIRLSNVTLWEICIWCSRTCLSGHFSPFYLIHARFGEKKKWRMHFASYVDRKTYADALWFPAELDVMQIQQQSGFMFFRRQKIALWHTVLCATLHMISVSILTWTVHMGPKLSTVQRNEANKWKKNRINRSMWKYFKLFAGNYTWMSNKNCTKTSKPVIVCCCTGVCVFSLNGQEKLDLISSHLLWLMDIINEMTFKNHPSFFFIDVNTFADRSSKRKITTQFESLGHSFPELANRTDTHQKKTPHQLQLIWHSVALQSI